SALQHLVHHFKPHLCSAFVASGSDLLLEAKTAEVGPGEQFMWRFNTTSNLVKFRLGSEPLIKYKERTVFSKQNYSLLLRNMQHSDSGNYKAVVSGLEEKTVTEYTVIVQDRVSPVNLTVTPIDRRFHNFTVTCRTVDSQINGTFQCNNKTCHLLNQTHLNDSSLKIYVEEHLIICNHSNKVSRKKDEKNVSSIYQKPPVINTATKVGISVGALALVVVSISFVVIKCKYLLIFSHNQIIVCKSINLERSTN
uniref:Ig-like domain-containing protein n=1 Tax=Poecilia mexicana TaxID=48701 RepID=A0A3B3YGF1_9TELE